jgi:lipid II:glycine glycyltransferase (peptidoglycan interpeptide bridge formation enzyme)
MNKNNENGEFLQSAQWARFQESVGRNTYCIEKEAFIATLIKHSLLFVGEYLYCPRGPIIKKSKQIKDGMLEIIDLAKKENAGWIRIDPENDEMLEAIKEGISENVAKSPHDMQPKEVFVIDIEKTEEVLLAEMKSKTRYNIKLAQKHGVLIKAISDFKAPSSKKYINSFIELTKEMALRNGITAHPENYYRKMIENLPNEMLKIYVAEYAENVIAANLVLFFGETVTYLHGASGNVHRNVMAPFLLQWQTIQDAKKQDFKKYDFGGVKTTINKQQATNKWQGITNFKLGFSPATIPLEFPGSYDIIINSRKYWVYRGLQRAKSFAVNFRK